MSDFAVLTVATVNYLHQATALGRSLRQHNPGTPFHVCLVDRPPPDVPLPPSDLCRCFFADELDIPGWRRLAFQYSALNLSQALKPFAAEKVLAESGGGKVIFLDADVHVHGSFAEYAALLGRFDLVLSPHILAPLGIPDDEEGVLTDLAIQRYGVYNSGFIGLRAGDCATAFLRWWQAKLRNLCIKDLESHIFVDQGWLDLVPVLFANVHVERAPQYNVAHWNAAQRPVVQTAGGGYEVGGRPLVFFHFSGFDPDEPAVLSPHHSWFPIERHPAIRELMALYRALLDDCGRAAYSRLSYGYARLRDGTPIKLAWREAVRRNLPLLRGVADPFDTDTNPDLRRIYATIDQKYPGVSVEVRARLRRLEALYSALNASPFLGRLLRRYKVFREAAPGGEESTDGAPPRTQPGRPAPAPRPDGGVQSSAEDPTT